MSRPSSRAAALLAAAAFAAPLLSGCAASTKMKGGWSDPNYSYGPMQNVLVVSIRREDLSRRTWEDALASALKSRGVTATSSYTIFPTAAPDTQQVIQVVREKQFDGVLVNWRSGSETKQYEVPGYVTSTSVGGYVDPFWGTYQGVYRDEYVPGYVAEDRIINNAVHVWSTRDGGKLVWAGSFESTNPSGVPQVSKEVTSIVIPQLEKSRIIKP
jgi:hypothetical protein